MNSRLYHLGYLLGAIVGDGCLYMYREKRKATNYFIELETADRDEIMKFFTTINEVMKK